MKLGKLKKEIPLFITLGITLLIILSLFYMQVKTNEIKEKAQKVVEVFYDGQLPCPDCKYVQTSLTLDHSELNDSYGPFTLTEIFVGKSDAVIARSGVWSKSTNSKGWIIYDLTEELKTGNSTSSPVKIIHSYFKEVNDKQLDLLDSTMNELPVIIKHTLIKE